MTWTADKGFRLSPFLVRGHRTTLGSELRSPLERVIALGALLIAGEEVEGATLGGLRELSVADTPWNEALRRYLAACDSYALTPYRCPEVESPDAERTRQLLNLRHECELSLWAARHLGISDPFSPEDWAELIAADDELREMLPWFISQNEWRQQMLSAVSPAYRKQFFWFEVGHSLPTGSLEALEEVDALLHTFPELSSRDERKLPSEPQRAHDSRESPNEAPPLGPGNPAEIRPSARRAAPFRLLAAALALLVPLGGWMSYRHSVAKAEQESAALQLKLTQANAEASREVQRLKASLADAGTMSAAQMETLKAQVAAAEARANADRSGTLGTLPCADRKGQCPAPVPSRALSRGKATSCPPGDPLCVD